MGPGSQAQVVRTGDRHLTANPHLTALSSRFLMKYCSYALQISEMYRPHTHYGRRTEAERLSLLPSDTQQVRGSKLVLGAKELQTGVGVGHEGMPSERSHWAASQILISVWPSSASSSPR